MLNHRIGNVQVLYKHVSGKGGGGSEGNAYFAYVVRGGSRGKMLLLLMYSCENCF